MTYRELYERALWDLEHNNITLGEFDDRVKPLNQEPTSVVEELEKIRSEIEEKQSKYTDRWIMSVTDYSFGCYRAYEETLKLIDKHISKIKGEQE